MTHGSETAVAANGDVVPAAQLRVAEQRIRELERALGRTEMELEILRRADRDKKKTALVRRVREVTARPVAVICRTLGIGRATADRRSGPRPRYYGRRDDRVETVQIRAVLRTRASYGYRRVTALVVQGHPNSRAS